MTKLEELVLHHILPDTYGDCHTIRSQKKYRRENIINMILKWHNQQNIDDGMSKGNAPISGGNINSNNARIGDNWP